MISYNELFPLIFIMIKSIVYIWLDKGYHRYCSLLIKTLTLVFSKQLQMKRGVPRVSPVDRTLVVNLHCCCNLHITVINV